MPEHDFAALDSYQLLPRVLTATSEPDPRVTLLGLELLEPFIPFADVPEAHPEGLTLIEAETLIRLDADLSHLVAVLKPEKMGHMMPKVRTLAERGAPGFVLDLTAYAELPPYGSLEWHPRSREELAELRAAAGVPFWLYGVASVADAETASEAGLEAVVVNSGAGVFLGAPATAEVFPEVFDAVAGTIAVYAGGAVRSGVDIFRYLALGAEAVLVETDRSLANLSAELRYAMRLTGCQTLADISYEVIFAPLFTEL